MDNDSELHTYENYMKTFNRILGTYNKIQQIDLNLDDDHWTRLAEESYTRGLRASSNSMLITFITNSPDFVQEDMIRHIKDTNIELYEKISLK